MIWFALKQAGRAEADVAIMAPYQMVVEANAQSMCEIGKAAGRDEIILAGRRIAHRMIMRQQQPARAQPQRIGDYHSQRDDDPGCFAGMLRNRQNAPVRPDMYDA